jgi:hypothetical protein
MLHHLFKKLSSKAQGIFSLILGSILILGTLGKLQILQGLLNFLMILIGLILIVWGLNATQGITKIQEYLQQKNK